MALGLAKVSLSQVRLALSSLPLLKALDVVDGDLSPPLPFPCEGLLGLGCTSGLNGEAAGTALEGMMCPRCAKATGTDYPFRDLAQAYALLPPGPAAPPPPQFKTSIRLGPLPALPAGVLSVPPPRPGGPDTCAMATWFGASVAAFWCLYTRNQL